MWNMPPDTHSWSRAALIVEGGCSGYGLLQTLEISDWSEVSRPDAVGQRSSEVDIGAELVAMV